MDPLENSLTYKNSGVDIKAAEAVVDDIARLRKRTERKGKILGSFGGFASGFDMSGYRNPVILTTCDGIGTKMIPLLEQDMLETAGIDLVAMNVNDILTSNAQPILFLDYIGIGQIDRGRITRLISGMADALEACGCILAGGETAEMPDMVPEGSVELSGFCVGAAEKDDLPDSSAIASGDKIIGIRSQGFHANGWSLIRKVIQRHKDAFSQDDLRNLLAPTRIYYPEVMRLKDERIKIKGMAHITGGGIPDNLARALSGKGARIKLPPWENTAARNVLQYVEQDEALSAFNMGFGWMIVVEPSLAERALSVLSDGVILGEVVPDGPVTIEEDS